MFETLKIIHFLSLAVGIGGGAANGIIGARMAAAPDAAKPVLGGITGLIGRLSAGALALLWITGIALVLMTGGFAAMPTFFWVKLAFVVVLTLVSIRLQMLSIRAARSGTPPPMKTMAQLGRFASVNSILIVVFAVVAFAA